MESIMFLDCNVSVGKSGYKHPRQLWRTEDIVQEMERCGISGALISHGVSKMHSPRHGNELLEAELAKSRRLLGAWVALPDHAGDFADPQTMISMMQQRGIHAVKLFPTTHQYDPDQRTIGKLLTALEQDGIPVFIEATEISFDHLYSLLGRHGELRVVLTGAYWGQERRLFPVMDAHPNLHIDFSSLQSNEIVEITYEKYGPDRLLYGSEMPKKSAGAARALIDYARIPMEAKRKMAGMNLAELLGVSLEDSRFIPHSAVDQDKLAIEASQGLPLSIEVLDSHTHLLEDKGSTGSGFPMFRGDIEAMIASYRSIGIRRMSIIPWIGISADTEIGNAIAEQALRKYSDEVVAYATIDPNYIADVEAEAHKWHTQQGFKGIKPYYFTSKIRYTDPVYAPWWKLGNEKRLFALLDPGLYEESAYLEDVASLAQAYPEISLFMDHAGRSFEVAEQYVKLARQYENVFLQITHTAVTLGVIEFMVKEAGAQKVLFGTDAPMRDPRPQLGWLVYANISMGEKEAIFGGNFRRILERCLI